jgi:hypothetical protein
MKIHDFKSFGKYDSMRGRLNLFGIFLKIFQKIQKLVSSKSKAKKLEFLYRFNCQPGKRGQLCVQVQKAEA